MALTTWYGPYCEDRAFSGILTECSVHSWGVFPFLSGDSNFHLKWTTQLSSKDPWWFPPERYGAPLIPVPSSYPQLYILPILEATSDVFWCLPPQLSNVTDHLPPYSGAHKCLQTERVRALGAQSSGYLTVFSFSPQSQISSACCTWNVLSYSYLLCFMIVFVNKSNPVSFILLWLKAGVPP